MNDRIAVLTALIQFSRPIARIKKVLSDYEWDSEELVTLRGADVAAMLHRLLDGKVTASELEEWANLIEGRDDIEFESTCREVTRDIVHQLANPLLTGKLDDDKASEMLRRLEGAPS